MEPFAYLHLMQDYEAPQREPQGGLLASMHQPVHQPVQQQFSALKLSNRATIALIGTVCGLWSVALSESAFAIQNTYTSYAGGGWFYVFEGITESQTPPVATTLPSTPDTYPVRPAACNSNCAPTPLPVYQPISPRCDYLSCGSTGNEVRSLQLLLRQTGYYQGPIDGVFGISTKRAVMRFQHDNYLVADGVVGPSTRRVLGLGYAGLDPAR